MPDLTPLRETIREILRHISDTVNGIARVYGKEFDLSDLAWPGRVRVVSSLAEGADQWIAGEALLSRHDLQCALPFSREEYENDFADPGAKAEYRRLLGQASAVLELDGNPSQNRSAAYEAAGRAVLNQTDVLLAIWDGELVSERGGTAAVISEALQRGISVVWVSWSEPHRWALRLPERLLTEYPVTDDGDAQRLKALVQKLLLPPEEADTTETDQSSANREQYFNETRKQFRIENFEELTRLRWERDWHDTFSAPDTNNDAPHLDAKVDTSYFRHFAWADDLSMYYAKLHRRAFLFDYLLAAAAVFLALFAKTAGLTQIWALAFVGLELATILTILGIKVSSRHENWHERAIDYRMLAERLRLARCLALFGGGDQNVQFTYQAKHSKPVATWMYWHYRAIERGAGLVNVRLTSKYLGAIQEFWHRKVIEDQIAYRRLVSVKYRKLDTRFHLASVTLFTLTLIACTLHFFALTRPLAEWLTFAVVIFAALDAALAGIRKQTDSPRILRLSRKMKQSLEQLRLEFASISARDYEGNSQRLRALAEKISYLMIREMLVILNQPLDTYI